MPPDATRTGRRQKVRPSRQTRARSVSTQRTAQKPAARPRRREKVRVGTATVNSSDLKGLRTAWRTRSLVLFLGAGVSMPYGMPSWRDLVLELLFEQAEVTRRLGRMWPHYRRAVASWMTDYFDYDPLVLARMVERDLAQRAGPGPRTDPADAFLQRLRSYLYANRREPQGRTTLAAIADLIAKNSRSHGVEAVVSFNFDDLLEQELQRRRVVVQSIGNGARCHGKGLRIIHAHGYIPAQGPLSRADVVFTEPDYHRLTESVFHWSLSEVVERLRKNVVLFVGLSMSDPSLRRLLDASRNSDIPPHWQIQKRHEVRDQEVLAAMAEVQRRAQKYAARLGHGFDEQKRPAELEDSIHTALRQADSYDREVFESMGVKTIWVDQFDQIPEIIDAIAS